MRVGATLPQFEHRTEPLLDAARRAERAGLDGVFLFDHLWPLGRPDRPLISSTVALGAVAAATRTVAVGTLVSRVGLRPDAVLVHEFETAAEIAPGRIIAGLGTGDRLNAPENIAYGVAYGSVKERLAAVARCARALHRRGIEVWVGGRSAAVREIAREAGAEGLNLWEAAVDEVADATAAGFTVTWGGPIPAGTETGAHLRALEQAGATWAVVGWPRDVEELAAAAP